MKALVKSKGLFLNPSLRRLGIVALRTVEVLEMPTICTICCRRCRRRHWRKNSLIGAIDKSLVARRRKRAVSLSQNLPEVPSLGGGFNSDSSLLYTSRLGYDQTNRLSRKLRSLKIKNLSRCHNLLNFLNNPASSIRRKVYTAILFPVKYLIFNQIKSISELFYDIL